MEISTEEFIADIRSNECLWNENHPDFKNTQEKQRIWEGICNKFNLPMAKAKRKWRGLKTTLFQNQQKQKSNERESSHKGPKWKHLKDMEFLLPLKDNRRSKNLDENKEASESESSISTDWETSQMNPNLNKSEKNTGKSNSNEDTVPEFIEAVKNHKCLWDENDPNFKFKEMQDNAWKEIETLLNIPAENCKKKWKCFKVYLLRECTKHPDNKSTWPYFKILQFVRPFIGKNDESQISFVIPETGKDFAELVIDEVQKRPILWDLHNKNYKSVFKKLKAWEEIAVTLNYPLEEVKKKWKRVRDIFSRSYIRNPDDKLNTWPYYTKMMFLTPHLKGGTLNARDSDDEDSNSSGSESKKDKRNVEISKKLRTEDLIEVMKEKRMLWDTSFENNKNVKMRSVVWKEVADHFGVAAEDCKRRWRVLRDVFYRNYHNSKCEEEKQWKYYHQLKFLIPHLKEKRNTLASEKNNLSISVDDSFEIKNEPILTNNMFETMQLSETMGINERDSTEEFIYFVYQREELWNAKNENFKNQELKSQTWQQLTDYFAMQDVAECKKKWKALRDAFARNYYRPVKEEAITWKYYQQLKFLIPNLRNKKASNEDSCEESETKNFPHTEDIQLFQPEVILKQEINEDFSNTSEDEEKTENDLKTLEEIRIEDIIEVVKQHEMLWNSNNPNYRNNDLRMKEWEEVANHFNVSVEDIKRKWKALRDSFVRNYFKPVEDKFKAWNYYSQMKFLGPHVKYKKSNNFLADNESTNFTTPNEPQRKFIVKEFINEIKKHTILWDLNDERCKSNYHRLKAWKEIATHFSVSSLECKRKWATLRGAFIREFAKHPNNATWENFEELNFLLPYLKSNVTVKREVLDDFTNAGSLGNCDQSNQISFDSKDTIPHQQIFADSEQVWIEDFIRAVEKQTILWDSSDVNYKKALKRQQAWNTIAKEFGVSINEAKRKWKSLRDSFAEDLNKHGCTDENATSRWKYYSAMVFLRPYLKFEMKNTGEFGYEANYDSDSCGAIKNENVADESLTIKFIETIRNNQVLWNWTDVAYKDEMKKDEAWQYISQMFNLSISDCKEKWQTLQNQYTRVLLSQANDRKCSWNYIETMEFLRPFIKTRMDSPNSMDISGCFGLDNIIEDFNFSEQHLSPKCRNPDDAIYEELFECSPSAIVQNIERNDFQINNIRERIAAKRKKESDISSGDDEDREFLQSVKEKIKKLPKYMKNDAKGHIEAYLKVIAANHHNV